jgi:hypothetical protein
VPPERCEACRQLFAVGEDDPKLAERLEALCPNCECEPCSVGTGSPGVVMDAEFVIRFLISPRDIDPETGIPTLPPFQKVYCNGLSVCREIATDDDVRTLLAEGLRSKSGTAGPEIQAACQANAMDIRACKEAGSRLYCNYDQTVSRTDGGAPVPTHAGIFLRLFPAPNTKDRKKTLRDRAVQLRELFLSRMIDISSFRNGLILELNGRAQSGEFR